MLSSRLNALVRPDDPDERQHPVDGDAIHPVQVVARSTEDRGDGDLDDQFRRRFERPDIVGEAGEEHQPHGSAQHTQFRELAEHQHRDGDRRRDADAAEHRDLARVPAVLSRLGDQPEPPRPVPGQRHQDQGGDEGEQEWCADVHPILFISPDARTRRRYALMRSGVG
jgi:hypothetical protein